MYKLCPLIELAPKSVQRLADNTFITFDPANTDYQAYLAWVSEGNTPLPAENE